MYVSPRNEVKQLLADGFELAVYLAQNTVGTERYNYGIVAKGTLVRQQQRPRIEMD